MSQQIYSSLSSGSQAHHQLQHQDNHLSQQYSSEGSHKVGSSLKTNLDSLNGIAQSPAFNINKVGRFKERASPHPQGRVLQQVLQQPKATLPQTSKFGQVPISTTNNMTNLLPLSGDQFSMNNNTKFLPRKKKSVPNNGSATQTAPKNPTQQVSNLPPMSSQTTVGSLLQQQPGLQSLSPVKLDDKVSKSTSNKAYMIGQQPLEDSKKPQQHYLKTYQKINTLIKSGTGTQNLPSSAATETTQSRFGKHSFLQHKENENHQQPRSQSQQNTINTNAEEDEIHLNTNTNGTTLRSALQSKLQQHNRNQNFLKKSRNSADMYSNSQKVPSSTFQSASNINTGSNYFSLKTKASSSRNGNGLGRAAGGGEYSQSWVGTASAAGGNGKLFQSLRHELSCIEQDSFILANYEPAKYSSKRNGIITAYGANTNQGIIRNYNEDRVAIILNIMKPKSKEGKVDYWPKCSFFGIYDGHGGSQCAEFLRDYLHQFIIKDDNFPQNPIKAIRNGFREAEKLFLEFAEKQEEEIGDIDRSGSCAIVTLIIDEVCYVANVGDSRAIMSADGGQKIIALSNDHKPTDEVEMKRITENGGKIYQNSSVIPHQSPAFKGQQQVIFGPHRVFPGRLSVSRTFGDIEAKLEKYEGNPNVVVAEPDITAFKIKSNMDFIVIGCDGIFDKLDNKDTIHLIWQGLHTSDHTKTEDLSQEVHRQCGLGVDSILKTAALRKACDNLTVVIIAFDNFDTLIQHSGSHTSLQEHHLDEILLPPLPETQDDNPQLNDPSLQLNQQPNYVLYLENEEGLGDDVDSTPLVNSDGMEHSQLNVQDISIGGNVNVRSSSFKIPTNNMLSEISEEDDISMISERVPQVNGVPRSHKQSGKVSQKVSRQQMMQIIQANQNLENREQNDSLPANQQDNQLDIAATQITVHPDMLINRSLNQPRSRQKMQDQIRQINSQTFAYPSNQNFTDHTIQNMLTSNDKNQIPTAAKASTPGHKPQKRQSSRNGLRPANSLKAQTQQVNYLLESINIHGNSSVLQPSLQQSIPLIRPTSSGKKRSSTSNGFNGLSVKEQKFSNTQQIPISSYNNSVQNYKLKPSVPNLSDINQTYFSTPSSGQQKSDFKRKNSLGNGVSRTQKLQLTMQNPSIIQTQQAYLQKLSGSHSSGSQGKTGSVNQKNRSNGPPIARWSTINKPQMPGVGTQQQQIQGGGNGGNEFAGL